MVEKVTTERSTQNLHELADEINANLSVTEMQILAALVTDRARFRHMQSHNLKKRHEEQGSKQ